MNLQNFETVFFRKQKILFAALDRYNALYQKYLNEFLNGNFDQKYSFDFNLLHDLEIRLKNRIIELQNHYYDLHWQKYNFNAY